MPTIEPIMLNQTGLNIINELEQENALLSLIAVGERPAIYSNITQIARIVRSGYGAGAFPVGDQIIIPWKDMDDPNHNTDATAYQVPLDIVHHGQVELMSGEIVPGMYVQWHFATPYGVQFCHPKAFVSGLLSAGTYSVTFSDTWGVAIGGSVYHFTLTQPVPLYGVLSGFEGMPYVAPANWKVKSWANPTDANPIETVNVFEGASGTDLGFIPYAIHSDDILATCMQEIAYGSNHWAESALRGYLNSAGSNWWGPIGPYDIRPDEYGKHGFLDGFTEEFLDATKLVRVATDFSGPHNTITGETFDRFFLPSLEQINATPQTLGTEGSYWNYWRRRLGINFGRTATQSSGSYDGFKTSAINAQTTPQAFRLRSANISNAYSTWIVNADGSLSGGGTANLSYRVTPVCVIC